MALGVRTALRISDLLRLCWDDVYDFENNRARESVTIVEKKMGKENKAFALPLLKSSRHPLLV